MRTTESKSSLPSVEPARRTLAQAAALLAIIAGLFFFARMLHIGSLDALVAAVITGSLVAVGARSMNKRSAARSLSQSLSAGEARSQLAAIVESSEDAIIGMTLDGVITSWNSGAESIYGYSAGEVINRSVVLLNPPDRPNEIPDLLQVVRRGKGINRYETERIRKDGRRLYVSASMSPIRDSAGTIVGASTIGRDITPLKIVEEKLRAHASQIETLYAVAQDVLGTLSLSEVMERALRRVIAASAFELAFIRFYDTDGQFRSYSAGSYDSVTPEDLESFKYLSEATVERMPDPNEPWFVPDPGALPGIGAAHKAAGMRSLAVLPLPRSLQLRGALTLMSLHTREFTPEHAQFLQALGQQIGLAVENASLYGHTLQINAHLKEEIEERKRAEKLLADFTLMVVHDLRAPLSNLSSIAESLEEGAFGAINDEQKQWLGKMRANCTGLVEQITEFLDLSKMEAGHIDLNKRPVDLATLLRDGTIQYSLQAGKHKIKLTFAIDADLPVITADARRLNRVLDNLLNNALKFTPDGGQIEIGARRENPYQVTVWVKDNGVGISADELPLVFEKYRQSSSGKQSKALGTGLGLAICKKLIEAHEGVLWVESSENAGATFFFSLPAGLPKTDDLTDRQMAAL